MALILSIETSTPFCSVALHNNDQLIGLKEQLLDKSHSEYLVPIIQEVVSSSGENQKNIDAIALSMGPGSYTGLRIGSSTAKGLCYALNIPLIAISTLEGLAKQVSEKANINTILCPMLDARRMEVYTAFYDHKFQNKFPVQPVIINESSFEEYFKTYDLILFGSGAQKCKGVINKNATYIDEVFPTATTIGELAIEKFKEKRFEDIAYFEPFYLKEFQTTTPKAKPF